MRKQLSTILFFGAMWGLLEATLGYALHFLPVLISGSIMFPIAALLLMIAYKKIGNPWALIYIGIIAASIKSVNFLMPGLLPIKTYNPMIAIVIQSLVMVGVAYISTKNTKTVTIVSLGLGSILWRGIFLINNVINHQLTGFNFPQFASLNATIEFMFFYGSIGAILAIIMYLGWVSLSRKISFSWRPHVALSLGLMVVALLATYFIH